MRADDGSIEWLNESDSHSKGMPIGKRIDPSIYASSRLTGGHFCLATKKKYDASIFFVARVIIHAND